jgi:hypothetical protein
MHRPRLKSLGFKEEKMENLKGRTWQEELALIS